MMHAVIRNSNDSLHLIGAVEPYNLESLKYHATSMQKSGGPVDLCIWVTRDEEDRLRRETQPFLDGLTHDGGVVHVRPAATRRGL
jgi:hypothetical protein